MAPRAKNEEIAMDLYTCDLCGYYYDPEYGDEENNIHAGTAFEKLSSDWKCPECGASKGEFYKLDYEELDDTYEEDYDTFDVLHEEYME